MAGERAAENSAGEDSSPLVGTPSMGSGGVGSPAQNPSENSGIRKAAEVGFSSPVVNVEHVGTYRMWTSGIRTRVSILEHEALANLVEKEPLWDEGYTACVYCDGLLGEGFTFKHKDDCPWLVAYRLIHPDEEVPCP